ncbi:hypothetical protein QR680_000055 [Steinernema hermaphroditum]|uniref:ZP domain-containing protein n=1 Tax=Steinernema hermaphroditum TaxID=289476 RepID=A0AA39GVX8_9BILA|nr:hypothetical protein QR680_000055 [Steinernema hermaphroditum]
MMDIAVAFLLAVLPVMVAIPIDNGVEGEPEIECGPMSISVVFNTRNRFDGHVFVKGRYDEAGCRSDENGKQVGQITLPFETCGVARTRSLNPRGIFISTTVIITFHPQFITKVDRAYRIQCFYMEADKTVSTQLEVSELTTAFKTIAVPMPMCRYEILEGGPHGEPVKFALIGMQVYHKWTCDSETEGNFCMKVHSCVVDDGKGDAVQLLDDNGCAKDKFLLNNLEYPTDLMAGQESHVYKYADRSELFFQCQDLSMTLERIQSGDMSVFDQITTTRLAIRAAVSQAFKTPEIIMLFVKKEPPVLRLKLENLESDFRLKRVDEDVYKERKYEILLALQKLGDELRSEEDQFLRDHVSFSPDDLELVG